MHCYVLNYRVGVNTVNTVPYTNTEISPVSSNTNGSHNLKFDYSKPRPDFMNSDMVKQALLDMITQITANHNRQEDIDSVYDQFREVVLEEMKASIPYVDLSKPVRKRWRPKKGFWDEELEKLWSELRLAEVNMKKSINNRNRRVNHRLFKDSQHKFDKKYRQKERKFKQSQSEHFTKIQNNDPRVFWQELNKLGPKRYRKIPMEVYSEDNEIISNSDDVLNKWKDDFQSLFSGNDETQDANFDNYIKSNKNQIEANMLGSSWEENLFLNRHFTMIEVQEVISRSKNGKATGIDRIPNEVIKNNEVIKVLTHLFQLCLDSGKVPSVWLRSIINPIEKSKENDPRISFVLMVVLYPIISLEICVAGHYLKVRGHYLDNVL